MPRRPHALLALALLILPPALSAQVADYPWRESFDTARVPLLPAGWSTSKAKSPAGDFTTTLSTPSSPPASALATDARIAQQLVSPVLSLEGKKADRLDFSERRSSTFNAGLLIEAAVGEDTLAWIPVSDTLTLLSSSTWIHRTITLPEALDHQPLVRLRWRTLGNGTGATGTLRVDDITLSVERETDLALDSTVRVTPEILGSGADASCTFTISNRAREGTYDFTLTLFDSAREAPVAEQRLTHSFAPEERWTHTITYGALTPGLHRMRCVLSSAEDEDSTNNTVRFELAVASPPGLLAINEIMYEPTEGGAEYLELYNCSSASVDIQGWTVADAPATKRNRTVIALSPSGSCLVRPHGYAILADDSSVTRLIARSTAAGDSCALIIRPSLSLNNTGDDIYLADATGAVLEHVSYLPSWHIVKGSAAGRSLERINPALEAGDRRNWSSSVAAQGGTPGARNSVYTVSLPSDATLEVSPNPFSPNGDGLEDFCAIGYQLPSSAVTLRVRIYDSQGRLVRTLVNNEPGSARGSIIWDGRDDHSARVRIGIYIIFLEALDAQGTVLRTMKTSAVVAARL